MSFIDERFLTHRLRVIPIALLPFTLLQVVAHEFPAFHPDLMDGLRGLLLGIVLGILILKPGARMHRAQARATGSRTATPSRRAVFEI